MLKNLRIIDCAVAFSFVAGGSLAHFLHMANDNRESKHPIIDVQHVQSGHWTCAASDFLPVEFLPYKKDFPIGKDDEEQSSFIRLFSRVSGLDVSESAVFQNLKTKEIFASFDLVADSFFKGDKVRILHLRDLPDFHSPSCTVKPHYMVIDTLEYKDNNISFDRHQLLGDILYKADSSGFVFSYDLATESVTSYSVNKALKTAVQRIVMEENGQGVAPMVIYSTAKDAEDALINYRDGLDFPYEQPDIPLNRYQGKHFRT